ncbi:hypothetical protein [Treponema sp. OMZ 791]|uniref:hypothetical protein n=1 Tax=Treponema sp. OMZ 791 TaxID=2563666 RepID=UPI0020A324CB|nr:hypothetical protein [Treponema sp. OMZ 791]
MKKNSYFICFWCWEQLFVCSCPIFNCYDNGDGTFLCEGGFSDGSSAAGVEIRIENPKEKDAKKKVLFTGKLDKNGELTIKYADIKVKDFLIIFDAGPGHIVKVKSTDIEK